MIFQDNVIKKYLKNVYFITGTPCGGKTTISRALAEKYGVDRYFNKVVFYCIFLSTNNLDEICQ